MQFRIYDRQTLSYKDGGYVANRVIDDDYIINNNSTITIVKELNDSVVNGDTIVLIQTSGAYHKGTITNFDNSDLTINYKSDKELFNDTMLNPFISSYVDDDDIKIAGRFDIDTVAEIIRNYFGNSNDWAKRIPLKVITDGDVDNMLWNWSNTSINVVDWLISLFERYNLSLNWSIDFNIANPIQIDLDANGKIVVVDGKIKITNKREPYYIVTLSAIVNSGKIIKDNVAAQTITYTERELPEATVCTIVDKETKEVVMLSDGKNMLNPNVGESNKKLEAGDYGTFEDNDPTSNISGYIAVTAGQTYTFSCKGWDGVARYVVYYDKDKRHIAHRTYNTTNGQSTSQRVTWQFDIPSTIEYNDEQVAPRYIKITYYNQATQIQLEPGSSFTSYDDYDQPATYYLINVAGVDMITLDQKNKNRVFPVKTKFVEFDTSGENTTPEQAAYENLVPSKFNQAIEIRINSDSKMFDFENVYYGDLFKIINEQGTINSNYTGRKEDSSSKWVTLYFGLGRQNYTDLIQKRLRTQRYNVLYNQNR